MDDSSLFLYVSDHHFGHRRAVAQLGFLRLPLETDQLIETVLKLRGLLFCVPLRGGLNECRNARRERNISLE